jgi:AcrR family transcriptional regulator
MMQAAKERTASLEIEPLILEAAGRLLSNEGPEALSVRRIATEAGVAPMGVYNHFESKSGIIDALFRNGFDRLRLALDSLQGIADPSEALFEAGRHYRSLALAAPQLYQLMFFRVVPGFVPTPASGLVALESFSSLVQIMDRAIATKVLPPLEPTTAAQIFWSAIHGWVSLEISGPSFANDPDTGADLLIRSVIEGLKVSESRQE